MKKIILIRHAKSDWNNYMLADFERPLNERGKKDAPNMAKALKKKENIVNLIISSPANRALTTAKIFAREYGIEADKILQKDLIYNCSASIILDIIKSIDEDCTTVLLFGHNPEISKLASFLSGNANLDMPTCSIAAIELDVEKWSDVSIDKGKLIYFDTPKKI